jgi:hypothetical protein
MHRAEPLAELFRCGLVWVAALQLAVEFTGNHQE